MLSHPVKVLILGQPVLVLSLYRQTPGTVATRVPVSKTLAEHDRPKLESIHVASAPEVYIWHWATKQRGAQGRAVSLDRHLNRQLFELSLHLYRLLIVFAFRQTVVGVFLAFIQTVVGVTLAFIQTAV